MAAVTASRVGPLGPGMVLFPIASGVLLIGIYLLVLALVAPRGANPFRVRASWWSGFSWDDYK